MDYGECAMCNGTGIDEADWSGRCFKCTGHGLVPRDNAEYDDSPDSYQEGDEA